MYKNRKQIRMIISWIAVLIWMAVIFNLSAQPAVESSGLSNKVTKLIIETVTKVVALDIESSTTIDLVSKLDHIVRKVAHGVVYFILGVLVINALLQSRIKGLKGAILSIGICVLYAISDEVHQMFVPGRGPQVKDVLIDSVGAVIGIGIYYIIIKTMERKFAK